eukprot:1853282-Rhodomonas_salina.1
MKEANNGELTEEDKITMRAEIRKVPYGAPPVPRARGFKSGKKISISGRCKELGFDGPKYNKGAMIKIGMIANKLYIAANGKPPPTVAATGGNKVYLAPQDTEVVDQAIRAFTTNMSKIA